MKVNFKAVAKAIVILVVLSMLPLVGRQYLPEQLMKVTAQSGFDINYLIISIAVIGAVIATFVLLRGHAEKTSSTYLALSTGWKILWLLILFYILGAGHPETFGFLVLGGQSGPAENTVVFNFRLFAVLSTIIVALMIARSTLQFREAKTKPAGQEVQTV